MFCYICEFILSPEKAEAFQRAYGPEGPWLRLFRGQPGYVRTELRRDTTNPGRFLTIDYWTSAEACRAFKERERVRFSAIDADCERLTESERYLGDFDLVEEAR
jgi:heme-degrading monooxygenase HmoA